jgi:hypothetical protein
MGKQASVRPEDKAEGQTFNGLVSDASAPETPQADAIEKPYNVHDKYKKTGIVQRIAKNPVFDGLTLTVITANAFWIGFDTNSNHAEVISDAYPVFMYGENFFAWYFTFEVILRFMAFEAKIDCLRDGWFKFDSLLVSLMLFETWFMPLALSGNGGGFGGLSILRLLRLLRLTRMARLMRQFPELMIMIQGMVAAGRSVTSTLVLLIITLYVFAIVFMQMFGDPELYPVVAEQYGSLPMSAFYLFMGGTLCDDITGRMGDLRDETGMSGIGLFALYVLISAFTVLNMLIGVLCEVVTATADEEGRKAKVARVQEMIGPVFDEIDQDGTMTVSRKEFEELSKNTDVIEAFAEVGIDVDHVVALADTLFEPPETDASVQERASRATQLRKKSGDGFDNESNGEEEPSKELSFDEFVEFLVRTSPDNKASVMDLADLRQVLRVMVRGVDVRIGQAQYELQLKAHGLTSSGEVGTLLQELDSVLMECEAAIGPSDSIEPAVAMDPEPSDADNDADNMNLEPEASPRD